ncbi:MAG TPA: TetR/AcrR family transcriptional regulator [Gemmatimonadaceae bacterium]|nr:TetR/AcrR family transcriptional regulator [Gemmatimonadaceae bacterium]
MSPRTTAQFEALRAEARERLERAALVVFARAGYARATVRDVAREAGVAQGLLYNYYRGKNDLLAAVFRRCMADVEASFAAADADAPPAERLARLVRAAFATVREHLPFWQLVYGVRHQPDVVAALGPALHAWTGHVRATLEGHLHAAGHPDPAIAARLLFATIDGVAQHFALEPERYPLDAVAKRLVAAVTHPPAGGERRRRPVSQAGAGRSSRSR